MYLKRIELFGFKSFADKSELSLIPGISAVIGPNGCGKSNLVDAVRWALGEQSVKSLRGNRMEEIIFSGSDSRKALNFAEVSLTFEGAGKFLNLDYDEITITRRLFRNGDSEYYINKSPCRLKDIAEMFLDTGLGKDDYSVIGQGRVDEIINSRPEERRELFEEAAGILKYKLRKKEAWRRLDETRDNLVRVQDLIYELNTQVQPLQEQAEITRQYRLLQQQIDTEEKKLLSYQLWNSRQELEKVNRQLQSVNDALLASVAQGGQQENELQNIKNNLLDQQKAGKEKELIYNQLIRSREQSEAELKLLKERGGHLKEQLEQNRRRFEQIDQQLSDYASQKEQIEAELALKQEELHKLENDLHLRREELNRHAQSVLAHQAEQRQEEIYKAGVRKEAAEIALRELKRRLEKLAAQKDELKREEQELTLKLNDSESVCASLESKVSSIAAEVVEARQKLKSEEEKEERLRLKAEEFQVEEGKLKQALQGIESRLQLLEEQDAALTGYYRGVKEVVQAQSSLPGIIGPVADLIKVESPYIQAVESALGSGLQYLVAETEKAVQDAIQFLKERNRGWATFLPLDIIHLAADPLERFPGWRELEGVIGRASELVAVDSAYRKAIDYLLRPVLVCTRLEEAFNAARFMKHSCRIVTLEGEMINPGGIVRGGSLPGRNASMPLGRRKEIGELREKQAELARQLADAQRFVGEARLNIDDQKRCVAAEALKIQSFMEQHGLLNRDLEKLQMEKNNLLQRFEAGKSRLKACDDEEAEIKTGVEDLLAEGRLCASEISAKESDLETIREDYRNYLLHKEQLEGSVTELLVRISSLRERNESLNQKIAGINTGCEKPVLEKDELQSGHEKYRQELVVNEESKKAVALKIEELNNQAAVLLIDLESRNQTVSKLEAEMIEFEELGRLRLGKISRQEKRERQLSLEQAKLETEINYQELHFRELFQSLELVDTEDDFDQEQSRQAIENLREDAEALGDVNLGAIEELARLEERVSFLTEQKDDLLKGEKSLNKVLAEIDQRMGYYFSKAFEAINANLKLSFSELFEGGQAMLKLTDLDNILDSGIEIIVQPPGKKLQNITLLSAGEKVLTAIALIFAILRFKPAPFYLLDEVESTLDDANLARFTKFLKENARQVQFIMITHRRRTMEEAGILYGVTMPEAGVSRLISLKLEECFAAGEK